MDYHLCIFLDLIISRHRILFLHNNSTYFKTYDRRISKKSLLISQHYKTFRFFAMCSLIAGPDHERTAVPDRVCTWKSNPSSLSDLSNDGCGYVPGDDSEPQSKDPRPHFNICHSALPMPLASYSASSSSVSLTKVDICSPSLSVQTQVRVPSSYV